jgi:ribosomal-protein-alanine N-acetyltransferase
MSLVAGEAELLLFVVDEKYQGKGLGRLFLDTLIDILQTQADALFLEVRAGNVPAIHLYESAGFNQVGERPNYYSTPLGREDALVFAMDWSFL